MHLGWLKVTDTLTHSRGQRLEDNLTWNASDAAGISKSLIHISLLSLLLINYGFKDISLGNVVKVYNRKGCTTGIGVSCV